MNAFRTLSRMSFSNHQMHRVVSCCATCAYSTYVWRCARVNAFCMIRVQIVIKNTYMRNAWLRICNKHVWFIEMFYYMQHAFTQFQHLCVMRTTWLHVWNYIDVIRVCACVRVNNTWVDECQWCMQINVVVCYATFVHDVVCARASCVVHVRVIHVQNVLFCVVTRSYIDVTCDIAWCDLRSLHAHIRVIQHVLTYKRCIYVNKSTCVVRR